ncbi:triphosphoribosyl-dephospho-CoA synthase [Sulfolobus sp. A20]|uniref:triphosphoribosyl-dephospho-CoA synthase n=1 Tax=Saccharolobus sp. A20 TaxID=1891280 RepID=UPI000845FFA9|nr:triphosphoribosyl-dephospho-CoA synthase [Sulfolobus sp. A20]TRM74632.1 triphosphoribosyl-dephospho-CoA synthase [Sulfolobus sp. A20-N-F8]TRM78687.1 triphosphoribosyl-dephospho-CoA synthase [Sulfolobus sp. B5]TRM80274.1 triphosphoribosyl-dephospho-CoA synthase [Sulfolobus sp. D5]TRM84884.1 triphosphoribosyl-dephospho-CoA synthase [Sulfolobus sp. F3]TRM86009.1 triphosphoribosyl-dephospho-CoA synthase [Sulfolobus sp. E3]TRM86819.1 triphosphoribosyl-dephospho-CoA synthase [Sulfolobus sp. C3]
MSEDLSSLCNDIAFILSQSTLMEAYVFKPGNANRFQDIKNVKFLDIIKSSILSENYYRELCIRKKEGKRSEIYDTLPRIIDDARKLGFEYQIFGTYLLLAPIAYIALSVSNVKELREQLMIMIKELGENESKYFLQVLTKLNLTYLGKMIEIDYRKINNIKFYKLLEISKDYDIVAYNMFNGYSITYQAYNIIKENLCGLEKDIQRAFIKLLSYYPDTLIFKKYGALIALKVSKYARTISECPTDDELKRFNQFLTSNNLNPGATADLIASALAIYYLDEWYNKKNSINSRLSVCD